MRKRGLFLRAMDKLIAGFLLSLRLFHRPQLRVDLLLRPTKSAGNAVQPQHPSQLANACP